jgi:hypothetical protein
LTAAGNGNKSGEGSTPEPSSTEASEADKQAAEKAREASKKAAEKAKKAADKAAEKAAEKSKESSKESGRAQLQLPPLIIRPATPEDKVSSDAADNEGDDSGSSQVVPTATASASADPNATTSAASKGKRKYASKTTTTTGQGGTSSTAGAGSANTTQNSAGSTITNSASGENQVTYVVSPLSDGASNSSTTAQNAFVKLADPTSNDPIRVVSAASLKTPADQFFEFAGWSILALGGGTAAMVSWGVYRGIRLRRAEAFDFEYRS